MPPGRIMKTATIECTAHRMNGLHGIMETMRPLHSRRQIGRADRVQRADARQTHWKTQTKQYHNKTHNQLRSMGEMTHESQKPNIRLLDLTEQFLSVAAVSISAQLPHQEEKQHSVFDSDGRRNKMKYGVQYSAAQNSRQNLVRPH